MLKPEAQKKKTREPTPQVDCPPQEKEKTVCQKNSGKTPVAGKVTGGKKNGGSTTGEDRTCRSTKPRQHQSKKANKRKRI